MPLYERRAGAQVVERVRTVPRTFEDTRLGLMSQEQKSGDGWRLVDETAQAPTTEADSKG